MKKIIATLTLIVAAALGAQGQITNTNTFYYGGTNTFTGLTLSNTTTSLSQPYGYVALIFRTQNTPFNGGSVLLTDITLSGDGITGTLGGFDDITLNNTSSKITGFLPLTTPTSTWNAVNSRVGFKMIFQGSAIAPPTGSLFTYSVRYSSDDEGNQVNTTGGDIALIAVPEPSAYAAAAGLLALFLWSSRRHFFKMAGARSAAASGQGENGAA